MQAMYMAKKFRVTFYMEKISNEILTDTLKSVVLEENEWEPEEQTSTNQNLINFIQLNFH